MAQREAHKNKQLAAYFLNDADALIDWECVVCHTNFYGICMYTYTYTRMYAYVFV